MTFGTLARSRPMLCSCHEARATPSLADPRGCRHDLDRGWRFRDGPDAVPFRRNLALGRINAELRATQALLAESAAQAERTRISRELHDAWGHDLTALSLQLEYASHVSPELGRASAIEARDLAKSLL